MVYNGNESIIHLRFPMQSINWYWNSHDVSNDLCEKGPATNMVNKKLKNQEALWAV